MGANLSLEIRVVLGISDVCVSIDKLQIFNHNSQWNESNQKWLASPNVSV